MVEYSIYRINNGGAPFISGHYDNIMIAKVEISQLVNNFEKHGYLYYIDNDYYNNVYPLAYKGTFYCKIICRNVSNWEEYTEITNSKNNLIFFR